MINNTVGAIVEENIIVFPLNQDEMRSAFRCNITLVAFTKQKEAHL